MKFENLVKIIPELNDGRVPLPAGDCSPLYKDVFELPLAEWEEEYSDWDPDIPVGFLIHHAPVKDRYGTLYTETRFFIGNEYPALSRKGGDLFGSL